MQNTLMGNALADRGDQCGLPRIPTGRFPAYSTTVHAVANAAGEGEIVLEAERDYLFTTLSTDPTGNALAALTRFDVEYCNTKYVQHVALAVWTVCCARKPVFLVGVRENKKLIIRFRGATPTADVKFMLGGFQGSGCCG